MFFLFFCARTANPCSCSSGNAVCAVYWETQLLFRGRIADIKYVSDGLPQQATFNSEVRAVTGPGRLEAHFHVTEKLRGELDAEVVIRTASQGSACGVEFREGAEYLVYGYQQANGEWWTNKCTPTHEIIDAEHDRDLLWIRGLAKAQQGGTIFGTVTQALPDFENNGYQIEPLVGISIRVKGPETRSVRTDDHGSFSVATLPIGKYEVSPQYANGLGPSAPSTVSVRDKGCAEVHFSAQSDGIVDGNLLNADLTPASDLYIRLKRIEEGQTPNWPQDLYVDTTDSAGHFHFEPVQPGAYVLGVNMDFPAQGSSFQHKNFYPGNARGEQAEIIHIVGAQHMSGLRYLLPPEPERKNIPVKVRVVLSNGDQASNASIELWNPQWPEYYWGPQTKRDAASWYIIELPEGGLYILFARVDDSDTHYPCAGPIAVLASLNIQSLVLVISGSQGSCFDQYITQSPLH